MDSGTRIDPFPTPDWFSWAGVESGGDTVALSVMFPVIYAVVFLIWLTYTVVVAYHWFRYGHRSVVAVPMLALHVVVSGTLLLIIAAGLA